MADLLFFVVTSGTAASWVADSGDSWLHRMERSQAGRNWWLVADFTAGGAIVQCGQLQDRRHPRQAAIEAMHVDIRNGIAHDPAPLLENEPAPWNSAENTVSIFT